MFDVETTRLIQAAPALRGVRPEFLPQELTSAYTELVALRLREDEPDRGQLARIERLGRLATVYEAAVDTGAEGEARRAAAFVSATAHQLLGQTLFEAYGHGFPLLGAGAIHPSIAAPLLFLIAEQNPDAREAARGLKGEREEDLLRTALIETIRDLAEGRFEAILNRGERLRRIRVVYRENAPEFSATQALYGLCWAGILQMVARVMDRENPETQFAEFELPQLAFDRVVNLAVEEIALPLVEGGHLVSNYAGPRHLARLLRHTAETIGNAGVMSAPPPAGANTLLWSNWLRHRSKSKPILWRQHWTALNSGMLDPGSSSVLVLPTGAGKTTLSEFKIAATLAAGRKVVFLVPTLALVDQLSDELAESFPDTLGQIGVSSDGDLTALIGGLELHAIEVMTPERCLALVSHSIDALADVGLVVFDECHLLAPQGGGKRSLDAMLCLLQVLKRAPSADLLLLSAMLTNPTEVAAWVENITGRPCTSHEDFWKPSRQARGVVVYKRSDLKRIRDSLRAGQPNLRATPFALFGLRQNWNPRAESDIRLLQISDDQVELAPSPSGYPTPNANRVAGDLATNAADVGLKTIVFVQQARYAPSTARNIADRMSRGLPPKGGQATLWQTIKLELGGAKYSLVQPEDGALPHNGDMLPLERRLAEMIFRRPDGANVIVATPTLAQGMNLPAQMAIIAGDKRHDDDGRAPLEAHEILNAAGRAGRAGHLANGVVLLVPEPVAGFDSSRRPEPLAIKKLKSLLPPNDRCVRIEDPITAVLDRIHASRNPTSQSLYFMSRVRAGDNVEGAINLVRKSFAAFQAKQNDAEAIFDEKVEALRRVLIASDDESETDVAAVAASHGLSKAPLKQVQKELSALDQMPDTLIGWSDWLTNFLSTHPKSCQGLLGQEASTLTYVVSGKKTGGPTKAREFEKLKLGLRSWLAGKPFCEIEQALGVPKNRLGCCPRARDLVLKLANRNFYLIASAISEIARSLAIKNSLVVPQPSVLETFGAAMRKGLDSPRKVAFAHLRPKIRSRVAVHSTFHRILGQPTPLNGANYETILSQTATLLMFAGD
jgi:ATP-dependent RNA helicase HelY